MIRHAGPGAAVLLFLSVCDICLAQTFRSSVQAVSVNVTVRDRNAAVGGLTAEDFDLTDNGVRQAVTAVALEAAPLDISLVLDGSGSMSGAVETLKKDVQTISAMLRPDDRLRVITFASRVSEVLPMRQRDTAVTALEIRASGATAFLHGLIAALLQPSAPGRPHLIVAITDGADNVSLLDGNDVEQLARRSDAILYVVHRQYGRGFVSTSFPASWGWLPYTGLGAMNDVREAAEGTGGRLIAEQVNRPLPEVFKQAVEEFRTGYVLWFTPAGVAAPGWHDLQVKVKGKRYDVTARRGYFGG